ncbi:MAG: low-specificity L-threonine aldolase [Clostridiales bacterium]|jgi:threonine aldolase|nr:low-specificity L-threonine aldolase [Clostridiales bacterium]
MKIIDLRSDTVTMPTRAMREAMATAVVGDDVYDDDPTVKQLEALAAAMTGKEAALFCPSGTMANQLAVMAFTKRGDEVILGKNSHIVVHEVGGAAVLSGVSYCMVDNPDDTISGADVASRVRVPDVHHPDTGLVCLENALANGTVVPLEAMRDVYGAAKKHGLPVYLDGARIFNAAVHLGCGAADIAQYCDALMFCISKGLCAPVGSLLCGTTDFIARAKRYRKLLGGGMRQAGVLAAAGLIALNDMTKRLHEDHENAQYLGRELAKIPAVSIDLQRIHINLVFFAINIPDFDHDGFVADLAARGIKINWAEAGLYRFVPHNDITRQDLDYALAVVRELLQK